MGRRPEPEDTDQKRKRKFYRAFTPLPDTGTFASRIPRSTTIPPVGEFIASGTLSLTASLEPVLATVGAASRFRTELRVGDEVLITLSSAMSLWFVDPVAGLSCEVKARNWVAPFAALKME